jgi:putative membrane protein insertion efficiency factor
MKPVVIFILRCYQALHGSFFWGSCRFHPTCSHYAVEAIESHGVVRGVFLSAWRVMRCQPFCDGGWDPVPPPRTAKDAVPHAWVVHRRSRKHPSPLTATNFSRRSL